MSETLASGGMILEPCTVPVATVVAPEQNMFKRAEDFVNEMRNKVGLINIKLTRDGVTRDLVATPDMTIFKYVNKNMVTVREQSRDYIINIEDYRTLSTPFTPEKFDIIEEFIDAFIYRYEVGSFNGEPPYIETGAYRTAYRVHTKFIKKDNQ